ncbi:MAG TPA: hypothetical protein VGO93_31265 [Candidatus Xenobia bacterium]|jgi:hypothetical protein
MKRKPFPFRRQRPGRVYLATHPGPALAQEMVDAVGNHVVNRLTTEQDRVWAAVRSSLGVIYEYLLKHELTLGTAAPNIVDHMTRVTEHLNDLDGLRAAIANVTTVAETVEALQRRVATMELWMANAGGGR